MTTAIVDCDLLEASKENIQPLQKGRRVTALSAVLSTPHPQRETQREAIKSEWRASIASALQGDGDPLEAFTSFVSWTLEAYPQGHSAESGLLELLEEATRVLLSHPTRNQPKYLNDPRYLALWILYAGYVEKPAVVYAFLLANEVGSMCASLYEEYAAVLERSGRCVCSSHFVLSH